MPDKRWTVLSSREVFAGRPHRLRLDTCRTATGALVADYFVREVNDVAMVFALTPDEQVVFVRQYRHGAGEEVLELPQGILEDGEDPIAAGARELREETGYESPRLERLSLLLSHPAVQTSRLHVLLAVDAVDGGRCSPEPDEDLEVVLRPLADLEGLVDRGEILASSSVAGIFLALRALARRP